jgi:hypothetical protein
LRIERWIWGKGIEDEEDQQLSENSRMGFVERLGIDDPRCRVSCKRKKGNVN